MSDAQQLAELIKANSQKRDSKRENEIRRYLRKLEESERLKVLQSMLAESVGGTYELAVSLLSGDAARLFFRDLVAASDASSFEHALGYGERRLTPAALTEELRAAMASRPELLGPFKYWRPALWTLVTAGDDRLRALSEVRIPRTQPDPPRRP